MYHSLDKFLVIPVMFPVKKSDVAVYSINEIHVHIIVS